jgi:hypothetical protein
MRSDVPLTRLCPFCLLPQATECLCDDDGAAGVKAESRAAQNYRGVIIIEWPAVKRAAPYNVMAGCLLTVTDAVSGAQIKTCTDIAIRANAEALVTADLTMLTDEDGEPLFDGKPVPDGGGFRTATFPFLVAEMRVRSD